MTHLLDQRRVPGISRLFADYLYDFERVTQFYAGGKPLDLDWLAAASQRVAYPDDRRRAMAAALTRQNEQAGEATRELLRRFAQPGAVAILTGQQVGAAGGPLLGLHKAMTAVALAGRLRDRGVNAVPIFWMASQDHDLAEVNHVWALDAASVPQRLELPIEAPADAPVGPLRLGVAAAQLLDGLARCTGTGMDDVRACYRPEATMAGAFAALFTRWFAPFGLIVFDPLQAPEAEALWAPLYRAVAERQPELAGLLAERGAGLEAAGYHAQVEHNPASTLLFLTRNGARQALRAPITDADRAELAAHPERVSPSALLRPVLQDVAFPTLAQVTGPAETAYLAQSAVLYAALGVRQPVVYPRASVTLLDPKAQRLLEKYQINLEQVWAEPAAELLARRVLPDGIERRVATMRAAFEGEFAALTQDLNALDTTLVDATQGALQKIRHQLEQLEARVARSFARRSGEITAQAQHLEGSLFPERHLQERLLGAAGWIARYPDLPQRLHDQLDPACPDHQILST